MQNAALSIALMKILDTKGIPLHECEIPSNLPEYAIDDKTKNKRENTFAME